MAIQRGSPLLFGTGSLQLLLSLLAGLLGSVAFHTCVYYFTTEQKESHLSELDWPLDIRSVQLDVRDRLVSRDLISAIGDLFKGALPSTDTGALSGILTSIENSITKLLGDAGGSILNGLADPAKFLGVGLASGAMTGLAMPIPTNLPTPTGVSLLAENLGSGLSSTIVSSDSVQSLLKQPIGGSDGTVGQAVLALGQGLGSGASSGLKLSVAGTTAVAYNTSGITGIAGNFGEGLSSSFLGNVQIPSADSLLSSIKGLLGDSNTTINIAEIGTSLGSGLGEGAAIGLGFQVDSGNLPDTVPGTVEGFTKGLTSGFLQNDTAAKLIRLIKFPDIDFAKVAEGLAVGLVSGVGSTISTLDLISANTTSFNDSVGGAVLGFGRGLGSESAKLVSEILDGKKIPNTSSKQLQRQPIGVDPKLMVRKSHYKRATTVNATDLASVLSNLNASNINPLVQSGVNTLTCEGVGGLAAVFLGLVQSKTIKLGNINLKDLTSAGSIGNVSLPDQDFVVKSGGNTYQLNPAKGLGSVTVNGMGIFKLIGVAAAHIIFAIMAHLVIIPLFLLAINGLRVTRLLNKPVSTKRVPPLPRWLLWLGYSIVPLTILTFGLGIGFRAGGKHFTTPHEILGLIVFIQALFTATLTQYIRTNDHPSAGSDSSPLIEKLKLANLVNIGILMLLTEMTLLFGFADLASLSLCISQTIVPTMIWVALGCVLIGPLTLAVGLEVLILWLKWIERREKKVANSKADEKIEKSRSLELRKLEV